MRALILLALLSTAGLSAFAQSSSTGGTLTSQPEAGTGPAPGAASPAARPEPKPNASDPNVGSTSNNGLRNDPLRSSQSDAKKIETKAKEQAQGSKK